MNHLPLLDDPPAKVATFAPGDRVRLISLPGVPSPRGLTTGARGRVVRRYLHSADLYLVEFGGAGGRRAWVWARELESE